MNFLLTNNAALILNNNFSNATFGSIGYGAAGDSLNSAQIYGNTLNEGVTFHVQLTYSNSFGWFIGANKYVDTNMNVIPPFFDPISSAAHISQ